MPGSLRFIYLSFFPLFGFSSAVGADEPAQQQKRPEVEVVFCLDTTSSMKGLIDAAKQKIWAISNQIVSGTPTPHVKVGLVAFRDRGDEYITKVFDLTDDLDAVHGNLMKFKAEGGGDNPESVNQALNESVTKINWSKDKKTLKIIFLVGDAPPHMDYADDVKYMETCKLAVQQDIIINTVQCGRAADTKKFWMDICKRAEGSYVQIDEKGGPVVVIATPFDGELAKINTEISKTTLVWGSKDAQMSGKSKQEANAKLAPSAAADRAAYYARSGAATAYDLITCIQNGTIKLEKLKKEELPAELQKLTLDEQKAYLKKLEEQRKELSQKAIDLDKKRGEFIAKKQAEETENPGRDSFDNQVLQILQTQANRNGAIQYGKAKDQKK